MAAIEVVMPAGRRPPHTPGPWTAHNRIASITDRFWVGKGKTTIADVNDVDTVDGMDTDVKTTAANANLIAAAPDLLAACRIAEHALRVAQDDAANVGGKICEEAKSFDAPLAVIRKAIAKAIK